MTTAVVQPILETGVLILLLLNPFLMSVYLLDLIEDLTLAQFRRVLWRACLISITVFAAFCVGGEAIFSTVLQLNFSAFLIFGGVVFLLIGLQHIFHGADAVRRIRGSAQHLAGSVAMPFIIGPGTISASIWAGAKVGPLLGTAAVISGVLVAIGSLVLFKVLYDSMRNRHQELLQRYTDIAGRIAALWTGSFAVQMIATGLRDFLNGT
jgi:small neutral amino acid transporter SnatA (MarC family)